MRIEMKNWVPLLWRSPEGLFLGAGLLFGLCFVVMTPPFQVPDEQVHFYRAYQISQGSWIGERRGDLSGGEVPKSLEWLAGETMQGVQLHPQKRIDRARMASAFSTPLRPGQVKFLHFPNPVLYAPISYAPQAIAIFLGRVFGARPIALMYFGRLVNLLAASILIFFAIRWIPGFKWGLVFLALLPMAVFQRASLSCDSFIHAYLYLFVAMVLRMAYRDSPISRAEMGGAVLASILVVLCKQAYFLFPLLFLIVPKVRFRSPSTRWGWLAAVWLGSFCALFLWSRAVDPLYVPTVQGNDLHAQIKYVLHHPGQVFWLLVTFYPENFSYLLRGYIGFLGWQDTHLPNYLIRIYAAALLMMSIMTPDNLTLTSRQRWVVLWVALGSLLIIPLLIYLTGMAVGADFIQGVQGRYLIPILPLIFVGISSLGFRWRSEWVSKWMPSIVFGGLLISLVCVIQRYYF